MSACVVVSSLRAQPPGCSLSRQTKKDDKAAGLQGRCSNVLKNASLVLFVFLLVTIADLSSWAHDSEIVRNGVSVKG